MHSHRFFALLIVATTLLAAPAAAQDQPAQAPQGNGALILIIAASIGGALLLAGVIFYFVQASGIKLTSTRTSIDIVNGTDGVYTLNVANTAGRARDIQLRVHGVPPGWFAALSFPVVKLQARDTGHVPLLVKVPEAIPPGAQGTIRVEARANNYSPWTAKLVLAATVRSLRDESVRSMPPRAVAAPDQSSSAIA